MPPPASWREYRLTIGLPHTNYRQLAEAKLVMEAGHLFWRALGEMVGHPVSALRTSGGDAVYPTIYFLDETYPADRPLSSFTLDDTLRFLVHVRSCSPLATEARVGFDTDARLASPADPETWWRAASCPRVRFGSLFAAPDRITGQLRLAAPANADRSALPAAPADENPARLTREAQRTGRLGVIPDDWLPLDAQALPPLTYTIDPDRDSNAARIVYFATYVCLAESGDRHAVAASASVMTFDDVSSRRLLHRRVAYYEQAGLSDQMLISVERFAPEAPAPRLGVRCRIRRAGDGRLLCLSESSLSIARPLRA